MSVLTGAYVFKVLPKHPLSHGVEACRRRWQRLTSSLFHPYRPELHYMRGPGPKWREKYGQSERATP
jgi:hypothetical protein